MALWTKSSRIEQLASFTGICGFIGAVTDLLTPVGNYTLLSLAGGTAILFIGLVLLKLRGFSSEATKGTLAFGSLLTVVSATFLVVSPGPADGNNNGALASKFSWIAVAQEDLLGLTNQVEKIAKNTEQIAKAADQIAKHTEGALNLNFSRDNFTSALDSEDATNIAMHCERGYRVDQFRLLFLHRDRISSDRNFEQLKDLKCFDEATLCDTKSLSYRLATLDDHRVETVCGSAIVALIQKEREAIIQRDIEVKAKREADFQECLQKAGDDFVEESLCTARYKGRY